MNWSDEHYVKLYTRESLTWRSWGWEARTTFLHLLKSVDHSGFIETGTMEPHRALAMQLFLPAEIVATGLAQLVASGTVELADRAVLITKFVEAQEARKTDAQKKRDERNRNIAKRRGSMSPAVTGSHPLSPAVTQTDPPAQPSPARPQPDPSPALVKASAPPDRQMLPSAENPPDKFATVDAFEQWFQFKRGEVGFVREKFANGRTKGVFWNEVHVALNGNPAPLEQAVYRFADDPHWNKTAPPMPFAAFLSEWRKYLPQQKVTR